MFVIETHARAAQPDTVETLAALIAELDSATEAGEFHDHVCEALCQLTSLERAGVLLYDPASHAVRAAGSYGVDPDLIEQVEGTLEETPLAQRALSEDRIVSTDDLGTDVPARYARFAGITTLYCGPISAGGRWLGIIVADQGGGRFQMSQDDLDTMLTFGRLAALAASVERATRQDERAQQLAERIELTREIHERVMQRLFGLTLATGAGQELDADQREVIHSELQTALADLRSALGRPIRPRRHAGSVTLGELVDRRAQRTPEMTVRWPERTAPPAHLEELGCSVFLEALRNCEKHSKPASIEVRVSAAEPAFELEITNDGVPAGATPGGAGIGLRLLTIEALQQNALVEFGPLPSGRWHVRLVGSLTEDEVPV